MVHPLVGLFAQLITSRWDSRSESLAIDWQGQEILFRELAQRVGAERQRLAALLDNGHQGQRVGILAVDGVANLVSGLALMGEGHAQAILPLPATPAERRTLARRYGLTHLLTAAADADALAGLPPLPIGSTSEGWLLCALPPPGAGEPPAETLKPPGDSNASDAGLDGPVALLASTSGTTSGRPAVTPVPYQKLLGLVTRLDWSPYDLLETVLLGEGLQNYSARLFKLRNLLQGRAIVIRSLEKPLRQETFERGCSGCPLQPPLLADLLRRGELAHWPRGFLCLSGSDHVPMDLRRAVWNLGSVGLGITYATSQSGPLTWLPPEELLEEEESVGRPLANVTLEPEGPVQLERQGLGFREMVVRKQMRLLAPAADGSLVETTLMLDGFRPGDLLARSPRGALIFAGRANDVFLFRTLLISPFEIEQVLGRRPEVRECLAFGAPSPSHGAVPMAAVVLQPPHDGEGSAALLEELRQDCRHQLGVRSPKKIVLVPELPRGPTGKPLRRVLAAAHALRA